MRRDKIDTILHTDHSVQLQPDVVFFHQVERGDDIFKLYVTFFARFIAHKIK